MTGRPPAVVLSVVVLALAACEPSDPELAPDTELVRELGLTEDDRVHTVELQTGVEERADPDSIVVQPGDYLQFVSGDWLVHEVHFDSAGMAAAGWSYLVATGQTASPPLLQEGARFVLSFGDAPAGAYPFRLEGNRASGRGVIVVAPPPGIP